MFFAFVVVMVVVVVVLGIKTLAHNRQALYQYYLTGKS
jgi:hypothetical protein